MIRILHSMSSRSLERGRTGRERSPASRRKVLEQSSSSKGLILGGIGVLAALGAAGGAAWLYLADRLGQLGGRR